MTWASRFKLFFGLIGVIAVVAVLTLVFNQRQAQTASVSATIDAERYPVGVDYGGTVSKRLVDDGDRVSTGDPLFVVQSPSLQADLAEGLVQLETVAYSVSTDGEITLTAAVDGTVGDVTTEQGSFVQAGQVLATIDRAGSLYVSADYVLSPRDYSRIERDASVQIVLPNQQIVTGTVESIEVATNDGAAEATARVVSDTLVDGAFNGLVARGTPVSTSLSLRDDGPLAGVGDGLFEFLRSIGI